MIIHEKTLVSEDVLNEAFVCDLNACKGACCVEGEYGAPLEEDELPILAEIWPQVKPYLTPEGRKAILAQGTHVIDDDGDYATTLVSDGGICAYAVVRGGVAYCGIERAFLDGKIGFQKPISCHLYPIRVSQIGDNEALNYHRWNICKAACAKGKRLQVPVFRFAKNAIVRKFGEAYYEGLEEIYAARKQS